MARDFVANPRFFRATATWLQFRRDRRNVYVAKPARSGQLLPSKGHRSKNDTFRRSWAIQLIVSVGCLLARSGSIFEGELGDSGFVELA